ncbi:MAG TPA: 2-dehydro-3-deoxygalactonokinase [Chitinophagaceae bacterium]|nr:2-dehydro-3-deoxygalactonokinase [Chitinophagaceae bacterium]
MHSCFLSCDWGSSSFRLHMVDSTTAAVLATRSSANGIAWANNAFQQSANGQGRMAFFAGIIQEKIQQMQSAGLQVPPAAPVLVSGMASANIGMVELPYANLPFASNGEQLLLHTIPAGAALNRDIVIISGVRTEDDVMRGEETQLLGCMTEASGNGLFIFPGTHAKHIRVAEGMAVHFRSFMTGELFQLMATQSMLAGSIVPNEEADIPAHAAAFADAVQKAQSMPLLHSLFTTRTNQLLKAVSKEANYHYLSGLLIGAELAGIAKETRAITICGAISLVQQYKTALALLAPGTKVANVDATIATIRGQQVLYKKIYG